MNTPPWKNTYWLIKRELWEHRGSFLWAPLVTGAVFLALNLIAIVLGEIQGKWNGIVAGNFTVTTEGRTTQFSLGDTKSILDHLDAGQLQMVGAGLDLAMYASTAIIGIVLGFVVLFYCLGALYNERQDRSILFWKSLPLSDTETVLSKVLGATLLAPLITFVTGALTGIAMLLIYAVALSLHGISIWALLDLAHPLQVVTNLIGSIPLYLLWSLPAVGWLMLCSAWSRSKPFLWALVLPLAAGVILSWFSLLRMIGVDFHWYWRHIFVRALLSVFPGSWLGNASLAGQSARDLPEALARLNIQNSYQMLGSPELWIGVAAGVAMLAAAVWLRRWRDDS